MENGLSVVFQGTKKNTNESNALYSQVLSKVYLNGRQNLQNTLVQRKYTVDKKSMSTTERVKDYKIEMESLKINDKIDVKNKNVNNLSLVKKYVDVESEEELKEIANRIMN